MIRYKLTDQELRTHNGFQWEVGVERVIDAPGTKLCSGDVFHHYDSPILAVMMNPAHANFKTPRLWEVECDVVTNDGTNGGSKRMTLIRELPLPVVTLTNRQAFGILSAKEVFREPQWTMWAERWLSGEDRTPSAPAARVEALAEELEEVASWAAAAVATASETASAMAAAAAAKAAAELEAAWVESRAAAAWEWAAARSLEVAEAKALAAEWADQAATAKQTIDFVALAEKAMTY